MGKNDRIEKVMLRLKKRYPKGVSMLASVGPDPFKVLISTILSARTKDENTARVSAILFSRFTDAASLSRAPIDEIENLIKSIGFYRAKAKHIKETSRMIVDDFMGIIPNNIKDLLTLPGVGRKTANCLLVYGYGIPAIAVDTHVHRISNRLGWVKTKTPEETEKVLEKILPKRWWLKINEYFVLYGKEICQPKKPKCGECVIENICKYEKKPI
ncbi:MAG: endonuclease III [Candidatus Altiarchaeota archaeon]